MHLNRTTVIRLAAFAVITLAVLTLMSLHFMKLPAKWFGVGRYTVTVQLPRTGGLYNTSNVTYRGFEVGAVQSVKLTDTGVVAVLSLKSGIDIPSELKAEVHSQSAIGEQYLELLPRNDTSPPLKNGDVVALKDTSVPPDVNSLLDAANVGLRAVPRDNLKTVVDESYTAVGGLGPELSRLVKGVTDLSIDARENLDPLLALIDNSKPVLDSQTETSDAIRTWATRLATVTRELQTHDDAVAGVIEAGGPPLGEARRLVERLQPTLPVMLANLVSPSQVALTYHSNIEQMLVFLPQVVADESAGIVANVNTKQAYRGGYLSFNLNFNVPPPCTTGFLPAQQRRDASLEDYPERAPGELYCRIPQDSALTGVRGARNTPCAGKPGKRAALVEVCEGDAEYVPINDGFNWKGDPNATFSGQDIPELPPGVLGATGSPKPAPPPVAAAEYNPATETYVGPDGRQYTQSDLAQTVQKDKTWQTMLLPPGG